eukprot:764936-Hanusia_phi.AAC.3
MQMFYLRRCQLLVALLVSPILGISAFNPIPLKSTARAVQKSGALQLSSQAFKPQKTQWVVRKASSMSFLPQQTQKISSSSLRNFHVVELSDEQRRKKVMDLILAIGVRDTALGSAMAILFMILGYSPSHFPIRLAAMAGGKGSNSLADSIWLLSCIAVRILTEGRKLVELELEGQNREVDGRATKTKCSEGGGGGGEGHELGVHEIRIGNTTDV